MKKLNITKDKFTESKYFQEKYGTLEYVSESGNVYKTSKGNIIQFKEMAINKDRFASIRADRIKKNAQSRADANKAILVLTKKLDGIRSCLQNVVDFVKEMTVMPDKNTGTDEEWAEYEENGELLNKLFHRDIIIPLDISTEVRLGAENDWDGTEHFINGMYVWIEYDGYGWYLDVDEKTQNIATEWKQLNVEDSESKLPSGTSKEIAKFIVTNMSKHSSLKTIVNDLMTMPDNRVEEEFNYRIDKLSDDEED